MSNLQELKASAITEVENRKAELIRLSDAIHATPELGFEEHESAAMLTGMLDENGFAVERGVAGLDTAFVATMTGGTDGPLVAILAEYDALR